MTARDAPGGSCTGCGAPLAVAARRCPWCGRRQEQRWWTWTALAVLAALGVVLLLLVLAAL